MMPVGMKHVQSVDGEGICSGMSVRLLPTLKHIGVCQLLNMGQSFQSFRAPSEILAGRLRCWAREQLAGERSGNCTGAGWMLSIRNHLSS
jgi:hypothetical protein